MSIFVFSFDISHAIFYQREKERKKSCLYLLWN